MYQHRFITSLAALTDSERASLSGESPFSSLEWLEALELSGCVGEETGWLPYHLSVYDNEVLVALLPGYIKLHSYGEYVFDWAWAEAYERHQLAYYPKWICAIPFTPVVGSRILSSQPVSDPLYDYVTAALHQAAGQQRWSGWHINFPAHRAGWQGQSLMERHGVQFHWKNHGYRQFEDFLNAMTSRKRKAIKKERKAVASQALTIRWYQGAEVGDDIRQAFYQCYAITYLKRSGHQGYLNEAFFQRIFDTMASQVAIVCAMEHDKIVAASLYLHDQDTLYGRYWGALQSHAHLHFELCYYQGIEYAIRHGLARFDAGAQGEHKLARGFEPVTTYSYHHISHPDFALAIKDYLAREQAHMAVYRSQCEASLPFKDQ
ncbi:GNAT family N-acetyltransferase [Pseudoalteromonas sp. DL2-H2.2]|uniref:GNAT family N-acetyltransferase n=1 Tax=Pseudoalteromonas sp. DL2-H2.2 TaxID=2908889 RepID=UPI001F3D357E|nr:GNAT family N-acetyltransferase [Pseudoalteromonas sp. DL2-H2.2]MCF2910925.1 GNAT family N-acetyltransferase [Pseudoalteromonas sp. DL2-H2.2]